MTPFAAIVGGGGAGFFGAALAHVLSTAADRARILDFIMKRDRQDSRRKNNPLKQAGDAHYLDSTELSVQQVVGRIIRLASRYL